MRMKVKRVKIEALEKGDTVLIGESKKVLTITKNDPMTGSMYFTDGSSSFYEHVVAVNEPEPIPAPKTKKRKLLKMKT